MFIVRFGVVFVYHFKCMLSWDSYRQFRSANRCFATKSFNDFYRPILYCTLKANISFCHLSHNKKVFILFASFGVDTGRVRQITHMHTIYFWRIFIRMLRIWWREWDKTHQIKFHLHALNIFYMRVYNVHCDISYIPK